MKGEDKPWYCKDDAFINKVEDHLADPHVIPATVYE